jgi:hypothetical protein
MREIAFPPRPIAIFVAVPFAIQTWILVWPETRIQFIAVIIKLLTIISWTRLGPRANIRSV